MRHRGKAKISACAAIEAVAVPANHHTIGAVQSDGGTCPSKSSMKATSPTMATTFASAGDHPKAANWPRALSTCPSSPYTP